MSAREHPSLPFVFKLIEDAAVRGVRCPTNDQITQAMYKARKPGWPSGDLFVGRLVKAGLISVDRYKSPVRIATILVGPHAGKSTADGKQASPWSIEDLERRRVELQTW